MKEYNACQNTSAKIFISLNQFNNLALARQTMDPSLVNKVQT